jgi:hypothetical protein
MSMIRRVPLCVVVVVVVGGAAVRAMAADEVAGNLVLVNDNAAWSWFEDERVIVDPMAGTLLAGTIGDASGAGGAGRDGNVDVAHVDLGTRQVGRFVLADITADDHNTAALMIRPDGRYLAMYSNHSGDALTRYRVSTNPHDATSWGPQQTFTHAANVTYNNPFRLSATGVTYNFTRTVGWDPNVMVSNDDGGTWSAVGKLLRDPANSNSNRPYLKYASNNVDRIDFITTEAHPRELTGAQTTGVYHGYLQGDNLYRSDGTLVGALGSAPPANAFTPLLSPFQAVGGTARTNGWTTDLAVGADGRPFALFTSRVGGDPADHRLYYARHDGVAWRTTELAKMGAGLYASEGDYTGLGALVPRDPNTVYISTNTNPATNVGTANHEIYKGVSSDDGTTWSWTAITRDSTVDNLRPVVPAWSGGTAVTWMRGTYTSYTNYDMAVVGLVEGDGESVGKVRYTDATPGNTAFADGTAVSMLTVTAGTGAGATDNKWHVRSGFGNGGSVLTAGESGNEDVAALRTTLGDVAAGTYDVFAFFFANPADDWQISAGLSLAGMRVYEQDFSGQATAGEFDSAVVLTGNTVNLYKAYVGRVTLDAAGVIEVFVDDTAAATGITQRTWYDGVGIAPVVVPEPGVGMAVGGSLWLLGRRRKATD